MIRAQSTGATISVCSVGAAFAFAIATFAFEPVSRANDCNNPLIGACINSDTYWPNPGPSRFATVAGTETVTPSEIAFGLVASFQSKPITLDIASPGAGGTKTAVVRNQVTGNFLFAYGVTNRLELDLAVPVTFIQSGTGTSSITGGDNLNDTAVRDVRFGVAYALVPRARIAPEKAVDGSAMGNAWPAWSLTARFQMSAPTSDLASFAGERTAVFIPSLAADYRVERWFFGAELGARIRPVTEFQGARVGTQLALGLGAGYDILERERLAVMAEARGYVNVAEQHDTTPSASGISSTANGKIIVPAEWFLGLRTAPVLGGSVALFGGGGGPIPVGDAITAPHFRFILGAVYAPVGANRR
ncbi:MAG: hypothetical protein FWD73_07645 [Polyangiaceae bacterium]|nr:hypothetical protein [Polyangiaceae bacterium]